MVSAYTFWTMSGLVNICKKLCLLKWMSLLLFIVELTAFGIQKCRNLTMTVLANYAVSILFILCSKQ